MPAVTMPGNDRRAAVPVPRAPGTPGSETSPKRLGDIPLDFVLQFRVAQITVNVIKHTIGSNLQNDPPSIGRLEKVGATE